MNERSEMTAAAEARHPSTSVVVIEPRPGWKLFDWTEIWNFRELLYFLIWRDIKVRYKQTILGALWAVLQPGLMMVVFTIFFSRLAQVSTGDVPYPIFVYAGLLPWFFVSNSVSQAGGSVVGNEELVTKIYFPRVFIPLGTIGAAFADFAIAFSLMFALMIYYGVPITASFAMVPVLAVLLILVSVGVGNLLAALTVAYRDFRYVVPFAVQLWMFGTPTIYMNAEAVVSDRLATWLPLNPVYGVISNFRSAVLGQPFDWYALGLSTVTAIAVLIFGSLYFRRVERTFADVI